MKDASRTMKTLLGGLVVLTVFALVGPPATHAQPILDAEVYFGGTGNERGRAIAISGSDLYVAGFSGPLWPGCKALLLRYSIPSLDLEWHATLAGARLSGVAPCADIVYAAGVAVPPAWGASDGVGGTEGKPLLAWYNTSGGLLGYQSPNFFPYRGCEEYGWYEGGGSSVVAVDEDSAHVVYATGSAQANWSNWTAVLAKYDSTGNLVWWRTLGDTTWGSYGGGEAVAWLNGYLYVAGRNASGGQAVLWKYDSTGNQTWVRRFHTGAGAFATDVAGAAACLYVTGCRVNASSGVADVLLLKYDEDGILQWSNEWGGTANDIGYGIAVDGDRVYVVGRTSSFGAGGKDVFLLEVDAADGTVLSTSLWGREADDVANDVAVAGSDIYVVGETASSGAGGKDLVLLRYVTGPRIVDIDIKPGSYPNAIKLGSHGVIPVAIFSSMDFDDFDATLVDADTVELAGAGVAVRGKGNKYMAHEEDVDGDGWLDLVVQVETENLDPGLFADGLVLLTGMTFSGQEFEGWDEIIIVPPE